MLYVISNSRKRAMQSAFPNEPIPPSLWEQYWNKFLDARAQPGPRFHKTSLKKFAPYALIIAFPLLLTILITQNILAVALMLAGCVLMGGVVLYGFNLREHVNYEREAKNEILVAESSSAIDDFIIPEDWSKLL